MKFKKFEEFVSEPLSPSKKFKEQNYLKINNINPDVFYLLDSDGNVQKPNIEEMIWIILNKRLCVDKSDLDDEYLERKIDFIIDNVLNRHLVNYDYEYAEYINYDNCGRISKSTLQKILKFLSKYFENKEIDQNLVDKINNKKLKSNKFNIHVCNCDPSLNNTIYKPYIKIDKGFDYRNSNEWYKEMFEIEILCKDIEPFINTLRNILEFSDNLTLKKE